jgi:hypothetical protein
VKPASAAVVAEGEQQKRIVENTMWKNESLLYSKRNNFLLLVISKYNIIGSPPHFVQTHFVQGHFVIY